VFEHLEQPQPQPQTLSAVALPKKVAAWLWEPDLQAQLDQPCFLQAKPQGLALAPALAQQAREAA